MKDGTAFERLYNTVKRLRGPGGCPWDIKQTPLTMREDLLEECYEAVEAISQEDYPHTCEELGDVFLNALMISYMHEQQNLFTVEDTLNLVCDKIIRRHPHVFGTSEKLKTPEEVLAQWDKIKDEKENRKTQSIMDQVPKTFPPVKRAVKIQKKAAKLGFDWNTPEEVWDKIREEEKEVMAAGEELKKTGDSRHLEEEIGDLMFSVINLSRKYKVDPEQALLSSTNKFEARFRLMEKEAGENHREFSDLSLEEMETLWEKAKDNLKNLK